MIISLDLVPLVGLLVVPVIVTDPVIVVPAVEALTALVAVKASEAVVVPPTPVEATTEPLKPLANVMVDVLAFVDTMLAGIITAEPEYTWMSGDVVPKLWLTVQVVPVYEPLNVAPAPATATTY